MAPEPAPQTDPLLAELNAVPGVELKTVDPLPPGDPHANKDPLEVVTPPAPSAVDASNARHSTAAGGAGYRVTAFGKYFAPAPGQPHKKILKDYRVVVNLPDLDAAQSILKNKVLPAILPKKYPDFIALQTHEIAEAVPRSPSTAETRNIKFMSRELLIKHIADYAPGKIDPADYSDDMALREAVVDYTLNPNGFEKRQAKKLADLAETAALEKLNPEMVGKPGVQPGRAGEPVAIESNPAREQDSPTPDPAPVGDAPRAVTQPDPLASQRTPPQA